jgi:hypothetical protein
MSENADNNDYDKKKKEEKKKSEDVPEDFVSLHCASTTNDSHYPSEVICQVCHMRFYSYQDYRKHFSREH